MPTVDKSTFIMCGSYVASIFSVRAPSLYVSVSTGSRTNIWVSLQKHRHEQQTLYAVVKFVSHLCGKACWNCVFPGDWGTHQTKPKTMTWTHYPKQICIISGAVVLSCRALHFFFWLFFWQKTEPNWKMLEVNTWYAHQRVIYSHKTCGHLLRLWQGDASSFPRLQLTTVLYFWSSKHCFFLWFWAWMWFQKAAS